MNFILVLFIILAIMFLASSANNLISVMGAVDHFMEISKVPDLFAVGLTDGKENIIQDYEDKINGFMQGADDYVDKPVHIKMLRDKIEDNPKEPQRIKTVWGVGYKYEEK